MPTPPPDVSPIEILNASSTVVVAVAAVVSAILTAFLLLEQRANRSVAQVEAYPALYGPSGMILSLRLHNYGPAPARDVELVYRLVGRDGETLGERRHAQPVLTVGAHMTFLPDLVIPNRTSGFALNDLAREEMRLESEWAWTDGRRRLRLGLPSAVHTDKLSVPTQQLRDDLHGGWSLHEETIQESLEAIAKEIEKVRKLRERRDSDERLARMTLSEPDQTPTTPGTGRPRPRARPRSENAEPPAASKTPRQRRKPA